MDRLARTQILVQLSLGVLLVLAVVMGSAAIRQLKNEKAEVEKALAQAQARLDEFYEPAKHVVTINGLMFKAIPELGLANRGYLVLDFIPVRSSDSGICGAGFDNGSHSNWTPVGEPFVCPDFAPRP